MPPGLSETELPDPFSDHQHHNYHHSGRVSLSRDNHFTFRKMSVLGANPTMDRKSVVLLGITLADEKGFKVLGSPDQNIGNSRAQLMLGTACVEDLEIRVEELRRLLCTEIPAMPSNFCFLTKEGWPLLKAQESSLKASHVVNERNTVSVKKQFEKQKVGIVAAGGDPIGFIFIDNNSELRQVREAIEQQLKISQYFKSEYRFIEKNGWPVTSSQEAMLTLLDILIGSIICLKSHTKSQDIISQPARPSSVVFSNNIPTSYDSRTPNSQDTVDSDPLRRIKSLKFLRKDGQNSEKGRKESQKRFKLGREELDMTKPILISYVRAESAQYALDLKQSLVAEGFSVYLDVHEIKTGTDWQDALNFAVTHCFLFVPLITPMYGKTQWTNREIKLADVLSKVIVPVNFMDQWPPACLAIQFASTQYIPWKLAENEHVKGESEEKSSDTRTWPISQMKRVTTQIGDCYKDNCEKLLKRQTSNAKEKVLPRSRPLLSVKEEKVVQSPVPQDDMLDMKYKIVISAHPKQRHLAQDLKTIFEVDGHQVWCSSNYQLGLESLTTDERPSVPDTPRDLPIIAEEEVFFSQDSGAYDSVGGNRRSVSVYYKEAEAYGRRPLSRLMSQFSDISQPSTLSQEKLDRLHIFQKEVDEAGVVVVLVSEDYTKSTFSHQQIFYCEHRKRVVMIKCDNAPIPKWFKLLMGNDMIMKINPQFEGVLKARVKRALNPATSETPKDATFEAKINYLVNFLKCNSALQDIPVYITGSSKLQTTRAEDICKAIGQELAKVAHVSLVTGGFVGASDVTAKAFFDAHDSSCQSYVDDAVVHILPMNETEDLSSKAKQNADGSFEAIPYGKTFFIGDNLKERETVVARMVDMCIVIEGGPGVVHEVEEFIWNDHFVIPIRSTGGAAGGKYGIPMKIFDLPPGVDLRDWSVLSSSEVSPEEVAKAVVNIIFSLRKAVSPTNTMKAPRFGLARKNRKKSKKNKNGESASSTGKQNAVSMESLPVESATQVNKYIEHVQHGYSGKIPTIKRQSWWQRLLRMLKK